MARTRSRIEKLRAPFVVTVALGASACGGVSAAHDPNEKPLTGADGGPSQAGCPTVAPVNGDPCAVPSGTTCSREATCAEPDGYSAECVAGVWQVLLSVTTCNPPAPWPYDSGLPWVSIDGGVAMDGGAAPPSP